MSGYLLTPTRNGLVDVEVLTVAAGDAVRAALLDAAGSPREVRTTTHHARPGFLVTRALAETAGLFAGPGDGEVPAPVKKPAAKKTTAAKKPPAKPPVVEEVPPVVDEVPVKAEEESL